MNARESRPEEKFFKEFPRTNKNPAPVTLINHQ
jgi:hypothetical protein